MDTIAGKIPTGEEIKVARERKALSQTALAKLAGVSGITLINWEAGKSSPRYETAAKIVNALKSVEDKPDLTL